MSQSSAAASSAVLFRQYRELTDPKKAIPSFHITLDNDNIYSWNIGVMILSEDSPFHGGYFKAHMQFPIDYPFRPPEFRFTPAIYHPNVYKDGRLCISILHQPGSGEPDEETWSPAQTVESVLISIVSLLSDPNINSPANVDAAVAWRKDRVAYNARVAKDVAESKSNIPKDFVMPCDTTAYVAPKIEHKEDVVDDDFWYESGDSEDECLMEDDDNDMDDEDDASDINPDYDEEDD